MPGNKLPVLKDNIEARNKKNKLFRSLIIALSMLTLLPIVLILSKIIISGAGQINFNFFVQTSPDSLQAMSAIANNQTIPGGIANGIMGTFLIVIVSSIMAIPFGIMVGIYLYEYQDRRYSNIVRNVTE
ncbi:MAG: phosphate ABC transporter, permease protein PstA, partial [Bacteroidota bacterium]